MIYRYVNAFNNVTKQWSTSGADPWLDAVDDTNRIYSFLNTAKIEEFTFASPPSGKPRIVKIQLYGKSESALDVGAEVFIHDSVSWQSVGTLLWNEIVYSWKDVDISLILDTLTKLQACKLYLVKTGTVGVTASIDCARLFIIMAYSTVAEVKEVLGIDPADSTWDTEIGNAITSADAKIDLRLEDYVSVPLDSPPQSIKDASKNLAAGIFQKPRLPVTEKSPFYEDGKDILNEYIKEKYEEEEIAFVVGEDTS